MIWYLKFEHGSGTAKDGGSKVQPVDKSDSARQKATQEEEPAGLSNNCNHREAGECHTGSHKCNHKDAA